MGLLTVLGRRRAASGGGGGYTPPASAQHYWSAHTLAGSVSDPVTSIADSVSSADLAVTGSTAQIVDISGEKWLSRDTASTRLTATISSIPSPYTILFTFAWRPTAPTSGNGRILEGNGATQTPRIVAGGIAPNRTYFYNAGSQFGINVGTFNTTPTAVVMVVNGASSAAYLRGGHTQDATGNLGTTATGTLLYLANGSSNYGTTVFGEGLVCNTALTTAEINAWGQQSKVAWTDIT